MTKYFEVTEYFMNKGLGIEFECSNENDTEITQEELSRLDLKPLKAFEGMAYHNTIKLVCVYKYNSFDEDSDILGYYQG